MYYLKLFVCILFAAALQAICVAVPVPLCGICVAVYHHVDCTHVFSSIIRFKFSHDKRPNSELCFSGGRVTCVLAPGQQTSFFPLQNFQAPRSPKTIHQSSHLIHSQSSIPFTQWRQSVSFRNPLFPLTDLRDSHRW